MVYRQCSGNILLVYLYNVEWCAVTVCMSVKYWQVTALSGSRGFRSVWLSPCFFSGICTLNPLMSVNCTFFPLNLNNYISHNRTKTNIIWILHHRLTDNTCKHWMCVWVHVGLSNLGLCRSLLPMQCRSTKVSHTLTTSSSHIKLHLNSQGKYAAGLTNISMMPARCGKKNETIKTACEYKMHLLHILHIFTYVCISTLF